MKVVKKENQAFGQFLGGAILENKPIGFPQDGGEQKPISNIFYWANAWSDHGGTIPTHPHKWFEIMSFVLAGDIEHYDTKNDKWLSLSSGDVQIIRAGNGISHSEKLLPNSRIFQIWFDPNIMKTKDDPATYTDYKEEEFDVERIDNCEVIYYSGDKGKVEMDAPVEIKKIKILNGEEFTYKVTNGNIFTAYLMNDKQIEINDQTLNQDDFVTEENDQELTIKGEEGAELFIIETPKKLNYKLYNELVKF